jgi:hypothetical protein
MRPLPTRGRTLAIATAVVGGLAALAAPSPAAAAAAIAGWQPYEDPSKTVTIDVPKAWRAGKPSGAGSARTSVKFALPDGAELTLSVASDAPSGERTVVKSLERYFPKDAALEVPQQTRAKNWFGVRQDATQQVAGKPRAWLGQFYVFGTTLVALTLSGDRAHVDADRADFERVIKTVRYHAPPIDTA